MRKRGRQDERAQQVPDEQDDVEADHRQHGVADGSSEMQTQRSVAWAAPG